MPEQDLGSNSLYVPLRTEEVGWEEGGLIWAPKRYFYPTVNLYGGLDDHVIGTYRGGPKGYRSINITDSAFALASQDGDDIGEPKTKTSKNGSKSAMPRGPATRMQHSAGESESQVTPAAGTTSSSPSSPPSSTSSTPSSSRRGSSSTDSSLSSGADTGMTTPTSDVPTGGLAEPEELVHKLDAALAAISDSEEETFKTRLASRTGAVDLSSGPVLTSRLAGPLKTQLHNNSLGLDRTLTLADTVPAAHFQNAKGRSSSSRSSQTDYASGWAYEHNMEREFAQ